MKLGALLAAFISLFSNSSSANPQRPIPSYPLGGTVTQRGAVFRVWAPQANSVWVKSDSPNWHQAQLSSEGSSGIWSGEVLGARAGDRYVFTIVHGRQAADRIDPEGRQTFQHQWSVLVDPSAYPWQAHSFVRTSLKSAIIYELHIGSFNPAHGTAWGTYQSVRDKLDYLAWLGVNVIELLPLQQSDRQYDWGYGVFAPNALEESYGTPDDFRALVDAAHQRGIGVLVDVVHNHYSANNALNCFDSPCDQNSNPYFYPAEHGHTPWGPRPNFSASNVRGLITHNIERYLNEYRVDGFRWDASPYISEFIDYDPTTHTEKMNGPNPDGIRLLQQLNLETHLYGGTISIAEHFAADPTVTQPVAAGGLGFDSRWMGLYSVVDAITQPLPLKISMAQIAESLYGTHERVIYTENHDEVGHPPRQRRIPVRIDEKNPGSLSARRRSLLGAALLMTAPGVPMLFQGQEFLEDRDFVFPTGAPLDWNKTTRFGGILLAYRDLIALRRNIAGVTAALQGPLLQVFHQDEASQVLAFRRWDPKSAHQVAVVANFGPQYFASYPVGLPTSGIWSVLFTSDDARYSGDFGGTPHARSFNAILNGRDGMPYSVSVEIAPFSAVVLGN